VKSAQNARAPGIGFSEAFCADLGHGAWNHRRQKGRLTKGGICKPNDWEQRIELNVVEGQTFQTNSMD
jgi:hypothetical protein